MGLIALILLIVAVYLLYRILVAFKSMEGELRELRIKCGSSSAASKAATTTVAASGQRVAASMIELLQKLLLATGTTV